MGKPARNGSGENPEVSPNLAPPWAPGKSANPGGRPKGLAAEVRRIYPADELVSVMTMIARGEVVAGLKPKLSDVQRANEWLADRGWGKAVDHVPVEGGDPLSLDVIDQRIEERLDELARLRQKRDAQKG
jgi:hypothetical protein